MPTLRTLAQLRTGVLRRTNCENDPNAEDVVDDCINDGVREMWGYKVEENTDFFTLRTTISGVVGTQAYALPNDFGHLRRLDRVDGTDRILITEAPPLLEVDFSVDGASSPPELVQYRIMGGGIDGSTARLYLTPDPGAYTYELWYVQSPQTLAADADDIDASFGEGRLVEAIASAQLCERQERDSTPHRAEQARALECCKRLWRKRDAGRPRRVTDIRSQAAVPRGRHPRP